jgi:WD40 repeat protein
MNYRFLLSIVCLMSCAASLSAVEPALVIDSGGNTRYVRKVIFTKDDRLVSVGDERVIRVWDIKSGRTERTIRNQAGPCGDCFISDIALSPDNTYLAVGGTFPGSTPEERFAIQIYNFETGERLQQLKGHEARISALAFSADGKQLASGSDYFKKDDRAVADAAVRVWRLDSQGWQIAMSLHGHDETVSCLAFSKNGEQLVSGSTDGFLFLWPLNGGSAPTGKELSNHRDAVFGAVSLPDGRFFSADLDGRINVWSAQGNLVKQLAQQPSGIRAMDLSADNEGARLLVGLDDGSARILSASDGKVLATFKEDRDHVRAVAFSGTHKDLVASTGGFNGEIWLWNAGDGKIVPNGMLIGSGRTVWSVGFARDGKSFAFGTERSLDAPNDYGKLEQVVELKPDASSSITQSTLARPYQVALGGKFIPQDYYSALTEVGEYKLRTKFGETQKRKIGPGMFVDEPVRLNELLIMRNGQRVNSILRDSSTGRTHLCFTFTHDGRYIISGGEGGYLALYDTKNPSKPLHEFRGHTNDVWSVAVSPDGRFVISGSSDQTIKLWDIKSDTYVLSIFVAADREWIAWTPQGYYTSSFNGDRYIGWQVEKGNLRPDFYKAAQFQKLFYRPDVISEFLATLDIQTAIEQAGPAKSDFWYGVNAAVRPTTVADNLPPSIEILAPEDNLTVTERLLKVKIRVTSNNLPITNVQVLLNGYQKGTFRGIPEDKERSRKVEIEMVVALKPEANTLVINASHDVAKSQPQTRTIFYKPLPGKSDSPMEGAYFSKVKYYPVSNAVSFAAARVSRPVAIAPPPTIRIVEPEASANPIEVSEESLFLRVLVPSGTAGRDIKVKILVNGEERHKQDIQPGLELPINIALDEDGEYTISAISIADGVESAPETRKIKYVNPKPEKPNLFFLGIGIKGYKNLEPGLEFADKDAEELAKLLSSLNESPLFKKVETRVLPNEQATRENILLGIKWLNDNAVHTNDVRVVMFSGHGGIFGDPIKQYYFYVQDQKPQEDPELRSPNWSAILARLLNKSGRGPVLLFVDTCRAGAATPKEFMNFDTINGLVFFGASGSNQKANENAEWGHGAFTRAVLEGLSGCADTSTVGRPADGMIDFLELGNFIQKRVRELNDSQTAAFVPASGLDPFNIALGPSPDRRRPTINCPKPPNQ